MRPALALTILLLVGCRGPRDPRAGKPANAADVAFEQEAETFYWAHLDFRPSLAVDLGHHGYDGRAPDRTREAITAEVARLRAAQTRLEAIAPAQLTPRHELEREVLLAEIRRELFDLEVRRRPFRDPFWYVRGFSLATYVTRDYAPAADRARAVLAACDGAIAYYGHAEANLEPALPAPWLQAGMMMTKGQIAFIEGDARAAFAELGDDALEADVARCLDEIAAAIGELRAGLEARMPAATAEFALGEEGLLTMLRETEGIVTDLATLERLARDDLARNRAALAEAARAIDPDRDVAEVIAEVSADKPEPGAVIDEATAMVATLRDFVLAREVASIPRDDVARVAPSPPYMRGNFAALGGAGPFEARAQPATFYLAPPDPAWPPEEQRAYLPSRADLLFIAAHEVWPGHFLQAVHQKASGSRVLQTFETYTTSEGWAHYVEEMMWEVGLGDGDPRAHIGQLKNALLRDARFLVALGLHAQGMTVDQAVAIFQEQAFADPGNARQQAMRGTLDPMFLGYTLGKLAIQKLRDDWRRRHPDRPLREFHDAFLAFGEAPLPVIRRMMLGDGSGGVL
jgi:hypothetical protein